MITRINGRSSRQRSRVARRRRELELEENLQRKDLTAFERSKILTELATDAEQVDRKTGEITRESNLSDSIKKTRTTARVREVGIGRARFGAHRRHQNHHQ